LEALEGRLPPGDWLLGALLGSALPGTSLVPEPLLSEELPVVYREIQPVEVHGSAAAPAFSLLVHHEQDGAQRDEGRAATAQTFAAGDNGGFLEDPASPPERDELFAAALMDPLRGSGTQRHGATAALPSELVTAPGHAGAVSAASGGIGTASPAVAGNGSDSGPGMTPPVSLAAGTSGAADGAASSFSAGLAAAPSAPEAGLGGQAVPAPAAASAPPPLASRVHARFDLAAVASGPFPSNRFTVADATQNTGRRVNLPLPDPVTRPSDYEDAQVINTLDGFNLQPRLSVPFDGPIDVNTVSSNTAFLVSLGDTLNPRDRGGQVVGINQVVWDPATDTLHVEPDELLAQHTRYALIVTDGVRDVRGQRVQASLAFRLAPLTLPFSGDPVLRSYGRELVEALGASLRVGVPVQDVVTASVFTTQSATAVLEKIRDQIHAATPGPADFLLGPQGERTVFNLGDVTGISSNQQIGADPPVIMTVPINLAPLNFIPGAVSEVAFGKYVSPDYEVHPGEYIPPVGTRTGTPVVQGVNELYFTLYLPSGPRPAGGWPVAIVGQGVTMNAATLAAHGIASIGINAVGLGFGPLSTLTVNRTAGAPVTFSAGGRGIDQNGDHDIVQREGDASAPPRTILMNTDGHRQTTADLMQLVRVIQVGVDVHGTGERDLDPSRIYYFGLSYSGFHGTMFLAVEPDVHAGALNVTGGPNIDVIRLRAGPIRPPVVSTRAGVGQMLAERVPSLLNSPGVTEVSGIALDAPYFDDNLPLRNGVSFHVGLEDGTGRDIRSPVINDVPGAMAIQELIDRLRWVQQAASPPAYAPHLRRSPLPGVPAKSVLIQFPKGDQTIPNPWETATLRAGHLADRATFYRHDLAFAEDLAMPTDPHNFVQMVTHANANVRLVARGYQNQFATFFESDGKTIIHPEPARFFEVAIQGPLPEGLNFIRPTPTGGSSPPCGPG
jgi:hypothetical protein